MSDSTKRRKKLEHELTQLIGRLALRLGVEIIDVQGGLTPSQIETLAVALRQVLDDPRSLEVLRIVGGYVRPGVRGVWWDVERWSEDTVRVQIVAGPDTDEGLDRE